MHIRKSLNRCLNHYGYEIVKNHPELNGFHSEPMEEISGRQAEPCVLERRKHTWIVAAPKSGSTWLTMLLAELLQWQMLPLLNAWDRREQEVQIPAELFDTPANILSPHQHCKVSGPTLDFIEQFRVRPIVTTRDIFDCVVSLRDHLLNESVIWPLAYVDDQFRKLSEEKQYDMVIAMFLPWFFSFYAGWFSGETTSRVQCLRLRYEDLNANPAAALKKILKFLGETRTETAIESALEKTKTQFTRKNQAVSGRGKAALNERQQGKIRELRQFYPHIDFSGVGLD